MSKAPPEPLFTFRGSMAPIHCLLPVLRDNLELVYAGTNDGCVYVWDLKSKREVTRHDVGSEACLCILPKNTSGYITHQKAESIKIWTEDSNEWFLQKVILHEYCGFCKMCFFNGLIFLPDNDKKIIIYDFSKNKEVMAEGEEKLGEIMCMKVIESLKCLLIAYETGDIHLLSTTLEVISKIKFQSDCPMAMDYCDKTGEGVLGTTTETFYKFKLDKEVRSVSKVREGKITNAGVSSAAVNWNGSLCVLGCWDGRVRYFSMRTLKLLAVLQHHTDTIQTIVFINDRISLYPGGLVVAGGKDARITLWNLYTNS